MERLCTLNTLNYGGTGGPSSGSGPYEQILYKTVNLNERDFLIKMLYKDCD